MKYSISIGLDNYRNFSKTDYAENDARAFHEIMTDVFKVKHSASVFGQDASFVTFNDVVNQTIEKLDENSEFYFFYAGHGENYFGNPMLTCYDSTDDIKTNIDLIDIISRVQEKGCQRAIYFIDACQSTSGFSKRDKVKVGGIGSYDFSHLFKTASYSCIFSAAQDNGSAIPHFTEKHGLWTFFLKQALSGEIPEVLDGSHRLLNNRLQNYLNDKVTHYCKTERKVTKLQKPHMWGRQSSDFSIFDFSEMYKQKKMNVMEYKTLPEKAIRNTAMTFLMSKRVKDLSGFNTGFKIPSQTHDAYEGWVKKFASEDLEEIFDPIAENLSSLFKFKRKEVNIDKTNQEYKSIETRYFNFSVETKINKRNHQEAQFVATLEILDPLEIDEHGDKFDDCFPTWFKKLIYRLNKKVNIEELIDYLEDDDIDAPFVDDYEYDRSEYRWVDITMSQLKDNDDKKDSLKVRVMSQKLIINFNFAQSVPKMFESLRGISNNLLSLTSGNVDLIEAPIQKEK